MIPHHQALITAARRVGAPVIHTSIGGYRTDCGDLGPHVRSIGSWGPRAGGKACEVIDELAPQGDDIFMINVNVDTFSGVYARSYPCQKT